jgi:hypothetical protein
MCLQPCYIVVCVVGFAVTNNDSLFNNIAKLRRLAGVSIALSPVL